MGKSNLFGGIRFAIPPSRLQKIFELFSCNSHIVNTVQLKTKLFCYADEVFGAYLRKERCHAATWMGLMITSSEGTGSERAFKLSIYSWTASVMF